MSSPRTIIGELEIDESGAYPAMPDNEYGWEKLYAERVAQTFGRHSKMAVRIARSQKIAMVRREPGREAAQKLQPPFAAK
jgi:nucleoside-diphosphate-sugar epimerase